MGSPGGVRGRAGFVVALPAEARTLAPLRQRGPETRRPLVRVVGMGEPAARVAAEALLAAGATGLVSWGIAAGLAESVTPGTLVLAERVVGEAGVNGVPWSRASSADERSWLDAIATQVGGAVSLVCGAVACPHRPLRTPIEKRLLGRTGAVAADMESVAVVDIAARAGVPWLVVRAVADSVAVPLPASVVDAIDGTGRLRWGRFGARLARHPLEIVQLAGLARGFWLALRTLRVVAERAGSVLVLPPAGRRGTEAESGDRAPGDW